ncbi:SDR family oxidoreductase [Streptomyces sp. ME19-01-6]|uniref:SDR family oxidoreductase n=1 Tax=Streptomyces sp. ME19-01-6 TaxID=3028686 RepID=UPI0039F63E35
MGCSRLCGRWCARPVSARPTWRERSRSRVTCATRRAWAQLIDGVDVVYHCGAVVSVWAPAGEFDAVNAGGTRAALEAAARTGARLLHVSSTDVYGFPDRGGLDESAPRRHERVRPPLPLLRRGLRPADGRGRPAVHRRRAGDGRVHPRDRPGEPHPRGRRRRGERRGVQGHGRPEGDVARLLRRAGARHRCAARRE